ncbi:ester cyclase [Sulfitobacter sabulilitoris]|nr:nuclear transport factor 2 family protein [Sulfitobacter sabulilitoris]
MSSKLDLLNRWYKDVWLDGDLDAIDVYFVPDTDAQGIVPDLSMGPTEFRDLVSVMRQMVVALDIRIKHSVENGNWLCALVEVTARTRARGAPIHVFSQVMVRFDGDKMVEAYNSFDFMTLFEQMGQVPPNSLPLMMTGVHLAEA